MHLRSLGLGIAAMIAATSPLAAKPPSDPGAHVNLKGGGIALHGFDAVAYFERHAAVPGNAEFTATYQGAKYQFADAADRAKFTAEPARYAPVYGGFCAYGVAQGFKVDVDPEAFSVVGDRLYLNVSKSIRDKWAKNPAAYIRKADQNWPAVQDKKSGVLGGLFG